MIEIALNAEEQLILNQVLRRCLSDLEHEIAHTDHAEFRQILKARRHNLQSVLEKLPEPAEATTEV